MNRHRVFVLPAFFLLLSALSLKSGWGAESNPADSATTTACNSLPESDHPKASISNGMVQAVVFLPDAQNGYYRASRFDWSGVIGCLAYKGHTYFGVWFNHYDPLLNDAITGPVEEFRSADGALNYNQAQPQGLFVKPGVGVLRKVDDSPYKFGFTYPLVDAGKRTVRVKRSEVSFTQRLQSPLGIAYVYEKTLRLEKNEPVLVLEHSLKNTGTKTIETDVYDHDFFMFDGTPTGPGMSIHFAFEPKAQESLEPAAKIEGKEIVYQELLKPGQTAASYLTGYSDSPADYHFTVEDRNTGVGVEQSADVPLSRFYLWSIPSTICPEAYLHLNIAPGATAHWQIRYRFFAK